MPAKSRGGRVSRPFPLVQSAISKLTLIFQILNVTLKLIAFKIGRFLFFTPSRKTLLAFSVSF